MATFRFITNQGTYIIEGKNFKNALKKYKKKHPRIFTRYIDKKGTIHHI